MQATSGARASESSVSLTLAFVSDLTQSVAASLGPAAATSGSQLTSSVQLAAGADGSSEKTAANPLVASQRTTTGVSGLQAQLGPPQKLQLPLKDPAQDDAIGSQIVATPAGISAAIMTVASPTMTATVDVAAAKNTTAPETVTDVSLQSSIGTDAVVSQLVANLQATAQGGPSVSKSVDSRFKTSLEIQSASRKQAPLVLDATPSVAGREAAQPAAIPIPASDSTQLNTSSLQSSTESHGRAGQALAQDPFTVMDAGLNEQPAQLLHASQREVEVGVHDATYGWVEIKTHLAGGQLNASVAASSHEAQHVLQAQLPALAEYLSNHAIQVDRLSLGSSGTATAGGSEGGSRQSGAEGQENASPGVTSVVSNLSRQSAAEVESSLPLEYRRNLRVDVMV